MTAPDLATARRLSVAPMMDWTDRYCRSFHRLLTRQALLYSEMVTTGAILKGARERFLAFDPSEQPLALQLGGSDPGALAESAARGAEWGYSEINLNCGCPSDRVQDGRFGACLMAEPELVRDGVKAMIAAVPPGVPVTVKCRIGIDREESYEVFERFVLTVAESGCNTFIVHARKAWLDGLSPKENREIPPLRYDVVARLKERNPALTIVLNGGIQTLEEAKAHRMVFDGVMLGRAAYQNPWLLASVDREIFGKDFSPTREEVVQGLVALGEKLRAEGLPIRLLARHALGLMNGLPGARSWRRLLSEARLDPKASPVLFQEAAAQVRPRELAA